MQKLEGKCALVTGAASGIGEGIARAFAAEGATVIVTDVNVAQGRKVARDIGGTFVKLDLRKEADWLRVERRFPQMDVVVNNAGVTGLEGGADPHDPEHASLKDWRAVHEVNLDGTFLGCRYALRAMRKNVEGATINMSSRSGMVGVPLAAAYASSKAAIRNHTKSVALYAAGQGLNRCCNSIHPAAILTPMWGLMLGEGETRAAREAEIVRTTPLRRFGRVEEVAALAVLLASDDCAYMTGAELSLDGGIMAG